MSDAAKLICIIGAESTGKTTLAQLLAKRFDSPWVPEYLRAFCNAQGRTPQQAEQSLILEMQVANEMRSVRAAQTTAAPFVFCDTAPLLTAIYSQYIFADTSLIAQATQLHERYALTLLLDTDIEWVADGMQRDGEHVRAPVTMMIEQQLNYHKFPYERVTGQNEMRLASAIGAMVKRALTFSI
jgi:NadR type nicotinamide-nucleotide adenylyltransferase